MGGRAQGAFPLFVEVEYEEHLTEAERFVRFHNANPWVYDRLVALASRLADAGHKRVGIAMLFEVLRYDWSVSTRDINSDGFKLSNNYKTPYARLIASRKPELSELFLIKSSRFDWSNIEEWAA